jgi:hypothetical protein
MITSEHPQFKDEQKIFLSSVVSPPHNPLPEGQRGVETRDEQKFFLS